MPGRSFTSLEWKCPSSLSKRNHLQARPNQKGPRRTHYEPDTSVPPNATLLDGKVQLPLDASQAEKVAEATAQNLWTASDDSRICIAAILKISLSRATTIGGRDSMVFLEEVESIFQKLKIKISILDLCSDSEGVLTQSRFDRSRLGVDFTHHHITNALESYLDEIQMASEKASDASGGGSSRSISGRMQAPRTPYDNHSSQNDRTSDGGKKKGRNRKKRNNIESNWGNGLDDGWQNDTPIEDNAKENDENRNGNGVGDHADNDDGGNRPPEKTPSVYKTARPSLYSSAPKDPDSDADADVDVENSHEVNDFCYAIPKLSKATDRFLHRGRQGRSSEGNSGFQLGGRPSNAPMSSRNPLRQIAQPPAHLVRLVAPPPSLPAPPQASPGEGGAGSSNGALKHLEATSASLNKVVLFNCPAARRRDLLHQGPMFALFDRAKTAIVVRFADKLPVVYRGQLQEFPEKSVSDVVYVFCDNGADGGGRQGRRGGPQRPLPQRASIQVAVLPSASDSSSLGPSLTGTVKGSIPVMQVASKEDLACLQNILEDKGVLKVVFQLEKLLEALRSFQENLEKKVFKAPKGKRKGRGPLPTPPIASHRPVIVESVLDLKYLSALSVLSKTPLRESRQIVDPAVLRRQMFEAAEEGWDSARTPGTKRGASSALDGFNFVLDGPAQKKLKLCRRPLTLEGVECLHVEAALPAVAAEFGAQEIAPSTWETEAVPDGGHDDNASCSVLCVQGEEDQISTLGGPVPSADPVRVPLSLDPIFTLISLSYHLLVYADLPIMMLAVSLGGGVDRRERDAEKNSSSGGSNGNGRRNINGSSLAPQSSSSSSRAKPFLVDAVDAFLTLKKVKICRVQPSAAEMKNDDGAAEEEDEEDEEEDEIMRALNKALKKSREEDRVRAADAPQNTVQGLFSLLGVGGYADHAYVMSPSVARPPSTAEAMQTVAEKEGGHGDEDNSILSSEETDDDAASAAASSDSEGAASTIPLSFCGSAISRNR